MEDFLPMNYLITSGIIPINIDKDGFDIYLTNDSKFKATYIPKYALPAGLIIVGNMLFKTVMWNIGYLYVINQSTSFLKSGFVSYEILASMCDYGMKHYRFKCRKEPLFIV